MAATQQAAAGETAARLLIPERTEIPRQEINVFIPLDATVEAIKVLNSMQGQMTFIRGAVASGKSTLASYLTRKHPDGFVEVLSGTYDMEWYSNIHRAAFGEALTTENEGVAAVRAQVAVEKLIKENKTLVIDEAHQLFGCPEAYGKLTKSWVFGNKKIKMLLFSATASGLSKNGTAIATPSEISKRYMWYPPMPKGTDLVLQLRQAQVYLNGPAIDMMVQICGMHRGIFMEAMRWVKEEQAKNQEDTPWSYERCLTEVRHSFQQSDAAEAQNGDQRWPLGLRAHMAKSRAVHVNGEYTSLDAIPEEVIQIIFGGSRTAADINNRERELTIAGFLLPERINSQNEFEEYNWGISTLYGISNPLMAQYYGGWLPHAGYQKTFTQRQPQSGPDLLARVFPYMIFSMVVDNVLIDNGKKSPPLSSSHLPYEDNFNGAMCQVLQDMGYAPVQPLGNGGKPDVVANFTDDNGNQKTCAIESIMAARDTVSYGPLCQNQTIS